MIYFLTPLPEDRGAGTVFLSGVQTPEERNESLETPLRHVLLEQGLKGAVRRPYGNGMGDPTGAVGAEPSPDVRADVEKSQVSLTNRLKCRQTSIHTALPILLPPFSILSMYALLHSLSPFLLLSSFSLPTSPPLPLCPSFSCQVPGPRRISWTYTL